MMKHYTRAKRTAAVSAAIAITMLGYVGCGQSDYGDYNYDTNTKYDYVTEDETFRDDSVISIAPEAPSADISGEEYNGIIENGFCSPLSKPLSTFSIDVDTASYSNLRRLLENGSSIPKEAIRLEEMINYFDYDYTTPDGGEGIAPTFELGDCPWNEDAKLLLVGLQTEEIVERPDSNLVFLIDVSGSMNAANKLPLVKQCFSILSEQLTANDRVSIVTYSGREEVVLSGARGELDLAEIRDAIDRLYAAGATAGSAGIQKAYELAEKYMIEGGNNRVILATDGDLNVGITSEDALVELIETKRESGVYLSVLGFGSGNYSDARLEALADNGNGNYSYIDSLEEGYKVFGEELTSTLFTAAKDVKVQMEFNPVTVESYRLIGYENRSLTADEFDDDRKDAGEMGAGQQVTALYELILTDTESIGFSEAYSDLKYQTILTGNMEDIATLHLRYKLPEAAESKEYVYPIKGADAAVHSTDNLAFAAAVAEFGMVMRGSQYCGDADFDTVLSRVQGISSISGDAEKQEFASLVFRARQSVNTWD
ncbi:MAG: DUF3520 domain-containing protein [Ruminococcus sp.]|nr:DUF3520 domain-containing protein [Ruminococcus sp.]